MWFQKSRTKWLQFGDRNTKFYHAVTTIRRRRNRYESLQNEQGEWVDHLEQLAKMATNYFKNLFQEDCNCVEYGLHGAFPTIQEEEQKDLERPVTNLEILQTINRMGGLKAPGPDGFQAVFYQTQWDIIGGDLSSFIKGAFESPETIAELNDTLISLIPKMEVVSCMKHFRPISLCNVSYKIVTKIIAQRLRTLMPQLIGPCQSSFVPNRQSGDNVIIAQEIFQSMRVRKGKKGWMAIKIDLEKAYDRLNWDFIKDTLVDIGLPMSLVTLIWHCISTSRMTILWNGERLQEFRPQEVSAKVTLFPPIYLCFALSGYFT